MRPLVLAAALVLVAPSATAQPRDAAREALRENLLRQAREARLREDYAACASYADAATAVRPDTLSRYGSALCARSAGLLPEARRYATACLAETEGDPALRDACRELLANLDALEGPAPAPPPPTLSAPTAPVPRSGEPPRPTAATPHAAPAARPRRGVAAGAIVLWAVEGAALATSLAGLVLWLGATDGCSAQGNVAVCADATSAARAADAGTYATLANVSFGIGVAAMAGGVAWFIVDRVRSRDQRSPQTPRVTGGALPGGAALAVRF